MSVNLLVGGEVIGAAEVSAEFHRNIMSDQRYVVVKRQPQPVQSSLQQTGANFLFHALTDIYQIDDVKIELTVRLVTKADKNITPHPTSKVGVVNNVLSSCIKDVKIGINNTNSKCVHAIVYCVV
jgi:hypothetical protein